EGEHGAIHNGIPFELFGGESRDGSYGAAAEAQPPGSAGGGEDLYPARSGGGVCAAGDALFHREGLLGDAAAGAESVLSRKDSVPAAAHRHELQVSGNDRVSRPLPKGDWGRTARAPE